MFHRDIQTPRRRLKTPRNVFDEIRGVSIADETLSRVFDLSSQSKQKLKSEGSSRQTKYIRFSVQGCLSCSNKHWKHVLLEGNRSLV